MTTLHFFIQAGCGCLCSWSTIKSWRHFDWQHVSCLINPAFISSYLNMAAFSTQFFTFQGICLFHHLPLVPVFMYTYTWTERYVSLSFPWMHCSCLFPCRKHCNSQTKDANHVMHKGWGAVSAVFSMFAVSLRLPRIMQIIGGRSRIVLKLCL